MWAQENFPAFLDKSAAAADSAEALLNHTKGIWGKNYFRV